MTQSVLALLHGVTPGRESAILGSLGRAFERHGHGIRVASFTGGERPPRVVRGTRMMVVMGSLDSVLDPEVAWLDEEVRYLGQVIDRGIPVLGVCFGAQLLAAILGGRVERAPVPEAGFVEVSSADPSRIPSGRWYAFHHDRIVPPCDSEVLATSTACVQAFRHGPHLGVQFHPEVTADTLQAWRTGFAGRTGGVSPVESRLLAAHAVELAGADMAGRADRIVRGFVRRARVLSAA